MSKRKRKHDEGDETPLERLDVPQLDQQEIDAELAAGGLAIFEADGTPFHVTPPDVANALRFFVSRLQQTERVSDRQTIALTSALEDEGVTTVARSLAAVLAHDRDRSVCLLETNWWNTSVDTTASNWWLKADAGESPHRRLGLADVLAGECTLEDALLVTSDPRLKVLSSGNLAMANRAAVASSTSFTDAVELLTKLFDMVIIDAPPVLKASESATIVRHADAIALVVRQGVTTENQVKAAIDELTGPELLGIILNRWTTHVPKRLRRLALAT